MFRGSLKLRYGLLIVAITIMYVFGWLHQIFELNFYTKFDYPYRGDIRPMVEQLKNGMTPEVAPINVYNYVFSKKCSRKCAGVDNLRLVYIIKSSPEHFERRMTIRNTWGENRLSKLEIRTVFLLGTRNSWALQKRVDEESETFSDIVQANFTDHYYNNTYKTVMGMQWAVEFCPDSKFYMFVDDDYYVSTRNVLKFLQRPEDYPRYLRESHNNIEEYMGSDIVANTKFYAGFVFHTRPQRHLTSKWYISLAEYPYHMWPPYINSGGYIVSKSALLDIYYSSFYTKHFIFDDIYIGIITYKIKIVPFHCKEFYSYKKPYDKDGFKYTITSHGYEPEELKQIWTEQRHLGHA